MKILENKRELDELLAKIRTKGTKIGLIPTMGSIHNGHLSLVENSMKENFFSITSIFINPTQFNDLKDFKKYPQNKKQDIEKLNTVKCDALFFPQIEELYPEGIKRKKTISKYRDILCDKFRPGHFDGVTTVVKSLFDIVTPDAVFFGEKDFQQLIIIKELIKKNNLPIQLIDCPSVRSKNGMSLSSRYNNFNINQEILFNDYARGKNIFTYGAAGTGKTFIVLYNAIRDVLNELTPYTKVYIVRSLVSTREIGFLPGDHEDKSFLYQIPYKNMVKYMFEMPSEADFEMLYGNLKAQDTISFWSTSFIRGTTFDKAIIIVDEFQNLNFHELDSIITMVGENSKIMFCGDATQSDLIKTNERNGIIGFMEILRNMSSVDIIEFGVEDIVRSGLVKEYILTKLEMGR